MVQIQSPLVEPKTCCRKLFLLTCRRSAVRPDDSSLWVVYPRLDGGPEEMPKNTPPRDPSYRKHKASGQARVTIAGRTYYLGKCKRPEPNQPYNRLMPQSRAP